MIAAVDLGVRAAVQDTVHAYARAVDRSDWAALRSLYHPNASIDHGAYQGDVKGFVDFVRSRRAGIVHTAHRVGNLVVEPVADGRVAIEVYGSAVQTFAAPSPLVQEGRAGTTYRSDYRYVDLLVEHGGGWVFYETHLVLGEVVVEHHDHTPVRREGLSQLPTTDDPLYGFLARWRTA